jgi:hypothetical protein
MIEIRNGLDIPSLASNKNKFVRSVSDPNSILVTLRVKEKNKKVVGFAKGGPLEQYRLRRGTYDENLSEKNTIFIESIYIQSGYWGEKGGHLLRLQFLNEAKKRRYKFVTGYVHRDVLTRRIEKGEPIKIVQKYDPDKLDYYRTHLELFNYDLFV